MIKEELLRYNKRRTVDLRRLETIPQLPVVTQLHTNESPQRTTS